MDTQSYQHCSKIVVINFQTDIEKKKKKKKKKTEIINMADLSESLLLSKTKYNLNTFSSLSLYPHFSSLNSWLL